MKINVIVPWNGGQAAYLIHSLNGKGLFEAHLSWFNGISHAPPADTIVLIRGVGHWNGSTEDDELLFELGNAIEREIQKSDYILPPKDLYKMDNAE
jgi:hypothetical protein